MPHPFLIENSTEMLREIKSSFDVKNKKYDPLEDTLNFKGLYILDDVGAEKLSEWVQETFYLIINKRYEEMRPTIITSNFNINDLAQRIGDRTVSRIVEMCDIVELKGKDKRMEKTNKIII